MNPKVEIQQLMGKQVRDGSGRGVGRIEAIAAERIGPRCEIREYHLGAGALLARLGITTLRLVGGGRKRKPTRVPWQYLDISDPLHPRLKCTAAELRAMQAKLDEE